MTIGPPWSSFSYVNWELSWWDNHLSSDLAGRYNPSCKLRHISFNCNYQGYHAAHEDGTNHMVIEIDVNERQNIWGVLEGKLPNLLFPPRVINHDIVCQSWPLGYNLHANPVNKFILNPFKEDDIQHVQCPSSRRRNI